MQKIRFFNPGLAYKQNRRAFQKKIDQVLLKGDLILRQDVEDFEKSLAKYVGVKYAVALNSGTDALYLALRYLKIGPGDKVLVPARTFVATVQVIKQVGAEPLLYDINGDFNFDGLMSSIKAIIPVHIEGAFDTKFEKILSLAKKGKLPIIEDACQALGATLKGKKAGSFGLAGCFSFYPAKILGAFGDAGALVTNDKKVYEWVKEARNHFKTNNEDWGVNSRMDNLQAAVLNIKFKQLDKTQKRRTQIAKMYDKGLCKIEGLVLPPTTEGRVWQDYIIYTADRDKLHKYLKDRGIETLKNNYPFPIPKLPQAQDYEDKTLRLPINEVVTDKEIQIVIKNIKSFYAK